MGFNDWADMCPHTITVESFTGTDTYGNYSYGSPTTYKARVQGKTQLVTTVTGEETVSHMTIYVGTSVIGPRDRITLPSPFSPTVPNILDVQYVSDESGQHHSVVLA